MKRTGLGLAVLVMSAAAGTAVVGAASEETQRDGRTVIRVERAGAGYLGVSLEDVQAEDVKRLGLADERGAVVKDVSDDSPAAKAGLKADDVIVSFEGEAVRSAGQLARMVRETPPGRSVEVGFLRGGARQQAKLTLDTRRGGDFDFRIGGLDRLRDRLEGFEVPEVPDVPEVPEVPDMAERPRAPRPPRPPRPPVAPFGDEDRQVFREVFTFRPRLGIEVVELTEQLARHFKVEDGLLVSSVSAGSPAEKAGLRAGDIVVKVDGEAVGSRSELVRKVGRSDDARQVTLALVRDGRALDVRVQLEPRRRPGRPTT
ncbi:MAG TPA: PDZ domain-containing protein [Vicinamibacteria bacterium]|nr:PDZ domain-containing protein [Vicinamibacteria bacterium]